MSETVMYQICGTRFPMMSFVVVTKQNNVIVIDGGHKEDMDLLKEQIDGRHISAWIMTHAHSDHIEGFMHEVEKNGLSDFDVEKIYLHFPPLELVGKPGVPESDIMECIPGFYNNVLPRICDKVYVPQQGESIEIDEVKIDFIFTFHDGLYNNLMNDSSLVFKLSTPNKSVIFLGDIGPLAGDVLYYESAHLLKADMVQMAHHGWLCCGMEVYAAIEPEACLWCCSVDNYESKVYPKIMDNKETIKKLGWERMHLMDVTRKWMEQLGVKKHYIAGMGTNEITL
ncbi:MAG: MBL fold metallo-hydrolase [Clostridia bacterium]|nr:MBL fold metallo-hydrolase [Clostridia bacterium]